jgi:beta-glucanase (GH16 family)
MRRALTLILLASACAPDEGTRWRLVWSDEFDGPAGARPDATRWAFETGGDGWGNGELQFHTADNATLNGAGHLVITARRETVGGRAFTSARLTTRGKLARSYGRFEAALQIPTGKGLWPAFWLLGEDVGQPGVGWPACGEIDVMEARGAQPWRVSSALHGPGYAGGDALIAGYETPDHRSLADHLHRYAVEWDADEVRFFVDDRLYHTERASRLRPPARWVFDHPFFLVLDLAVGGTFGGPPDESTPFPATLRVDYVRVYAAAE